MNYNLHEMTVCQPLRLKIAQLVPRAFTASCVVRRDVAAVSSAAYSNRSPRYCQEQAYVCYGFMWMARYAE